MAINYDLNNTGPEVQARLDKVFPNEEAISQEAANREEADVTLASRIDDLESVVGEGGTIDERIASAVSAAVDSENEARQKADTALSERIDTLDEAVGSGGSVDQRINNAKSEIIGNASNDYNTLGKLEYKILEEAGARAYYDGALQQLYENLVQSGVTPMSAEDWEALEEAPGFPDNGSLSEQVIYRVAGDVSYSDKMYYVDPDTQVGRVLTMATYDNAIDDVPTYNSDNLIKSKAVFDEFVKNSTLSPVFIESGAFSYDPEHSIFSLNSSIARDSLVIRYDGKSKRISIPGLFMTEHYCYWVGMAEFGVWESSNCLFFSWDTPPADLTLYPGLKYIGVSYTKEQHALFEPQNASIQWSDADDEFYYNPETLLNRMFLSDFTSSTKSSSSIVTGKLIRRDGTIVTASGIAYIVYSGITPKIKGYSFSGDIFPTAGYSTMPVVTYWENSKYIGYDSAYYKAGRYTQENTAELTVPLNCDEIRIQCANIENWINSVKLNELTAGNSRIASKELNEKISGVASRTDFLEQAFDVYYNVLADSFTEGSFINGSGSTVVSDTMGYKEYTVTANETLRVEYNVGNGYVFPIILFEDDSDNIISYLSKNGPVSGTEIVNAPSGAVKAICNYQLALYATNNLQRPASKVDLKYLSDVKQNSIDRIKANKALLRHYSTETKTPASIITGKYFRNNGDYKTHSSMSIAVFDNIDNSKYYRFKGNIIPGGFNIPIVSYWTSNEELICLEEDLQYAVGPYNQSTPYILSVPSNCSTIKIQAYNTPGYLNSIVFEEITLGDDCFVADTEILANDINSRFYVDNYTTISPIEVVSGRWIRANGTVAELALMGYKKYSVTEGTVYGISYNLPNDQWNFPVYVFEDSEGTVLSSKSLMGPSSAINEKVIAPTSATVVYCNYILSQESDFSFKDYSQEFISLVEINQEVKNISVDTSMKVVIANIGNSSGMPFYIRAKYNSTKDIIITHRINDNGILSFNSTYIGPNTSTDGQLMTSTYLVSSHTDSTAPLFSATQYWHLFAQHGYPIPYFANTGVFAASDLGALWEDQLGRRYNIGKVTSSYVYLLPVFYESGGHIVRDWHSTVTSTTITYLSHISGGTFTDTISIPSISQTQLRPVMTNSDRVFLLDGKPVTQEGTYYCGELSVSETQIGYDPSTVQDWFGGINGKPNLTGAEVMAVFTYSFNYKGAQCCINTTIDIRREIECQGYGATQQQFFLDNGAYKAMFILPKVKEKDNINLEKPFNSTSGFPEYSFYRTENDLRNVNDIPDRQIGFLYDPLNNTYLVGMSAGLSLVSGDTVPDKRNQMCLQGSSNDHYRVLLFSPSNTNKFYVMAFNTSPYADNDYYLPNTFFKEINYYVSYFDPAENVGQVYWYKDGNQYVIYCHCQQVAMKQAINVPDFMEGLSLQVVEKTDNTTLLTDTIQNGKFFVSYATDDANYIVLKTK